MDFVFLLPELRQLGIKRAFCHFTVSVVIEMISQVMIGVFFRQFHVRRDGRSSISTNNIAVLNFIHLNKIFHRFSVSKSIFRFIVPDNLRILYIVSDPDFRVFLWTIIHPIITMLKIRHLLVHSTDHFMFVLSFYQQRVKTWDEYASHLIPRIDDSAGRRGELVIQGSHMVSGTRCPAWSDQVK